jgi:hypothetical protein
MFGGHAKGSERRELGRAVAACHMSFGKDEDWRDEYGEPPGNF